VLLLDEADSFLLDRRGAQLRGDRSQRDAAADGAPRRRVHLHHQPARPHRPGGAAPLHLQDQVQALTAEQRERMFVTEALGGKPERLTPDARRRLSKLEQLCPGDFAAVKRQVDILATEFAPDEFLDQLEAEHRIKPEVREQRGMGFVQ
jgi:hypothetical protein